MVHQDCVPFHVEDGSQLITNDGNNRYDGMGII